LYVAFKNLNTVARPSRLAMAEKLKLNVVLVTGRTIEQGVGKERGKSTRDYVESVSVCYMDPKDMKKLGVKDGVNVQVSTAFGSVVVKAKKSLRAPHPGLIYIPYGPWANVVVDPETHGIGMPTFKGVPATVKPAPDKSVLSLEELIKQQFRKG